MNHLPRKVESYPPIFIICLYASLCFSACESASTRTIQGKNDQVIVQTKSIDIEQSINFLKTNFDPSSVTSMIISTDTILNKTPFQKAYSTNEFNPFWINAQGVTKNATEYVSALQSIRYDGLDPEKYHLSSIENILNSIKLEKANQDQINQFELLLTHSFFKLSHDLVLGSDTMVLKKKDWKIKNDSLFDESATLLKSLSSHDMMRSIDQLRPSHYYYQAFRNEYKRLDSLKKLGGWPQLNLPLDAFTLGDSNKLISELRKRLFVELNEPSDITSPIWDETLVDVVKKFQHLNYIRETGKIDSITSSKLNIDIDAKLKTLATNMERLRFMKREFPQPYIWVDVPKMELNYVDHDTVAFNMRIVVGKPTRPTPLLEARLANIVFSPPWTVPPTIMKEDVIPGINRKGSNYLARHGLKVYDKSGHQVSASSLTAKNYKSFKIGQAPGYRSSLGEVKFNLPNPWSIYLHDTPHRDDFVKFYRAYSSGCIRVHHPKEFAAFLLQDSSKYSYNKIDSICKKRKTIYVPFKRDVMVHIVYLTNALDSAGRVMYLKDIYNWDNRKPIRDTSVMNAQVLVQ